MRTLFARTRLSVGLAVVIAACCLCLRGSAQPAAPAESACCKIPQSPRRLTAAEWNWTSTVSAVKRRSADTILYTPREGVKPLLLGRCSQHYHCEIENVQDCPAEIPPPAGGGAECGKPKVGTWVEIHTVYHAGPVCNPTPENLDCCTKAPLVVMAYQAKVTAEPILPVRPVPVRFGPESAEWSGSATGPDKPPPPAPPECKAAAYWSFVLGCGFKVSEGQLDRFTHPDPARGLQPKDRLSNDLTHVVKRPPR
jgi:hypothetical protein